VTLIIGVLTEQYVSLVSDRRTTWKVGTKITRQEDTDTKTFNLCGEFLMGFTGLARIDALRMERWVADVLGKVPPERYFTTLTDEIQSTFDRLGISGKQLHAFLAVGYASPELGAAIEPVCVTISNYLDSSNNLKAEALGPRFRMHIESLGNRRQLIRSAGGTIRDTTMKALVHRIRIATRGEPDNPLLSAGPLVMALRDAARRSKNSVGENALFASLPKVAFGVPGIAVGPQVDYRRQSAALYIPAGARPGEGTTYVPAIINPGIQSIGIKIEPGVQGKPPRKEEGY
jgi:hypothetical protein